MFHPATTFLAVCFWNNKRIKETLAQRHQYNSKKSSRLNDKMHLDFSCTHVRMCVYGRYAPATGIIQVCQKRKNVSKKTKPRKQKQNDQKKDKSFFWRESNPRPFKCKVIITSSIVLLHQALISDVELTMLNVFAHDILPVDTV